jgi:hypothetical protein
METERRCISDRKEMRDASQASLEPANRTAGQRCLASTVRRLGAPFPHVEGSENEAKPASTKVLRPAGTVTLALFDK